jgi:(R,R)-butanediol dehydrogenase/meso-butanediol dehydrogenase/diacetyl reductase
MKAAIFQEAGKPLAIADVADPKPGPGELLLAVKGCGICGSDLHVTELSQAVPHGAVMGHEYAGEILEVGKDAYCPDGSWKVGDRVCTLPAIGCGRCPACAVGDIMGCVSLRTSGFGDLGGGYAEYVLAGGQETLRLPDNVSSADGALVEPLAVGLHAVDAAGIKNGEDVLVLGGGPVGLACAIWARHFGAREVVVSDYVEGRRNMAAQIGATALIDPGQEEVAPAFERIAGGPPSLIFECVGRPGVIQDCIGMVKRGGKVLAAGMCMQPDNILPMIGGVKEATVQFVSYYRRGDYALTVDMLRAERIDPSPMVTDRIPLDALPDAFEALRKPSTQCKVIVEP